MAKKFILDTCCENCGMDKEAMLKYAKSFLRSKSYPECDLYWKNIKESLEKGVCPCKGVWLSKRNFDKLKK